MVARASGHAVRTPAARDRRPFPISLKTLNSCARNCGGIGMGWRYWNGLVGSDAADGHI